MPPIIHKLIQLTVEEKLFGIIAGPYPKELLTKCYYKILFMRYFIY